MIDVLKQWGLGLLIFLAVNRFFIFVFSFPHLFVGALLVVAFSYGLYYLGGIFNE